MTFVVKFQINPSFLFVSQWMAGLEVRKYFAFRGKIKTQKVEIIKKIFRG